MHAQTNPSTVAKGPSSNYYCKGNPPYLSSIKAHLLKHKYSDRMAPAANSGKSQEYMLPNLLYRDLKAPPKWEQNLKSWISGMSIDAPKPKSQRDRQKRELILDLLADEMVTAHFIVDVGYSIPSVQFQSISKEDHNRILHHELRSHTYDMPANVLRAINKCKTNDPSSKDFFDKLDREMAAHKSKDRNVQSSDKPPEMDLTSSTPTEHTHTEIDKIIQQLEDEDVNSRINSVRAIIKEMRDQRRITHLNDIAEDAWDMLVSPPRLLDAKACWISIPPTEEQITKSMLKQGKPSKPSTQQPFHNGNTVRIEKVLADVLGDGKEHVAVLDVPLGSSKAISFEGKQLPGEVAGMTSNWAKKRYIVDWHVDGVSNGISAICGSSKRLWFFAPPTESNIQRIRNNFSLEVMRELEDVILVESDETTVVHLPAGCFHATITLQQGFLVGTTYVDAACIKVAFLCLRISLVMSVDKHLDSDWSNLCSCITLAMKESSTRSLAEDECVRNLDLMQEHIFSKKNLGKEMTKVRNKLGKLLGQLGIDIRG